MRSKIEIYDQIIDLKKKGTVNTNIFIIEVLADIRDQLAELVKFKRGGSKWMICYKKSTGKS